MKFIKIQLITTILFICMQVSADNWIWTDYEVVGHYSVSREQITKRIPIKLGSTYVEDSTKWRKICSDLVREFKFAMADCSSVRFVDGRSYFVVNIIEKENLSKLVYRSEPSRDIPWENPKLLLLFKKFMDRMWFLFSKNISPGERVVNDYVDFDDPQMHALVQQLRTEARSYRKNLVDIIRFDRKRQNRANAAWLLCWAGDPLKSIEETWDLINDPAMEVRNDLIRFMSHWVGRINNHDLLRKIIDQLALQISYPSHADRNKSIISLRHIVTLHKNQRHYVRDKYYDQISYLAKTSILENVGGEAKVLLNEISHKTDE